MTWQPTEVGFPIAPPTLAELLGPHACEAWLSAHHDALARSPAMVEQAAAVGLVARLWMPADAATRKAVLDGTLPHPSNVATVWMRALGDTPMESLAFHRAADLRSRIHDATCEDVDALPDIANERDILESVRMVLAFVHKGRTLGRELAAIDEVAIGRYPTDASRPRDPWSRAVFLAEPDAWWAGFAEPSGVLS